MKNFLKKTAQFLLALSLLVVLIYLFSYYQQKNFYKKYDSSFNTTRQKIGLQNIDSDWTRKNYNWDHWKELGYDHYNNYLLGKYFSIFKGDTIPIGVSYQEKTVDSTLIRGKYVEFGSNILFWKNTILSETDYYEKYNDSLSYEILTLRYYFEDNNQHKDYFKIDYHFIDKNTILCGTPRLMQEYEENQAGIPHQGNRTKKQADSILKSWNISNELN